MEQALGSQTRILSPRIVPFPLESRKPCSQQITEREIKQPISDAPKPLCWRHPRRESVLARTAPEGLAPSLGQV